MGSRWGIALAILLWQALGRHSAVKPQWMLNPRSETFTASPNRERPAHTHFVGLTDRTAVCGPACTVVWQGRVGDHSPYADLRMFCWPVAKLERHVTVTHAMRRFESCPASQI